MMSDAKPALDIQGVIAHASTLSNNLHLLLSNDRQHVNKTNRDSLCLLHWSLIFEHHGGILLLLRESYYAPAFALLRPFIEAFLRSYIAMTGTEHQVAALWAGNLNNIDFVQIWSQIDQRLGSEQRFGLKYRGLTGALHGFTHGGKEQLVRQASGLDIVSSFTEDEVRGLVKETMPVACLAAVFMTDFLGYAHESQMALTMFSEYTDRLISGQL
jgi:hypothetical protein